MDKEGQLAIINGIRIEAENRASEIISTTERQIAQRYSSWANQEKQLLKAAETEAEKRAAETAVAVKSRITVKERRERLRAQEELILKLIADVRADMVHTIDTPEYISIITNMIIEAAIGLGMPEAKVQMSAAEQHLINDSLLRNAETRIMAIRGTKIRLNADQEHPLPAQGVVLTSPDGSIAFSNQVPVRIERYQAQIRHIIYELLFKGE
ncbi:MAG: V-type ATP synthase subunit E family protein [Spirochaetes bacterium]|jgi:vacuolar-type H+-ATPase subunit E/Vma4|nr:V-type ATP synthase subunit E family protein [Spirochaetota bacterium]